CLRVAAGDRWPVALHHLVGDAAPQHRPGLVHEAGEEGVYLVIGDSFPVVDAAVQGDVDTEGQEPHGVLRSRYATSHPPSGRKGHEPNSRGARPGVAQSRPNAELSGTASWRGPRECKGRDGLPCPSAAACYATPA